MTLAISMERLRIKNVEAFIEALDLVEHRSATMDDICQCLRLTDGEARIALRKLERQNKVRHVVTFEPIKRIGESAGYERAAHGQAGREGNSRLATDSPNGKSRQVKAQPRR